VNKAAMQPIFAPCGLIEQGPVTVDDVIRRTVVSVIQPIFIPVMVGHRNNLA
jgi:hypothetical protein